MNSEGQELKRSIKELLDSVNPIPWYRNRWTLVWAVLIPLALSVVALLNQNKQLWDSQNILVEKVARLEALDNQKGCEKPRSKKTDIQSRVAN